MKSRSRVRYEWHALDHVIVNDSQTSPPANRAWDWFHLNSIDPEPDGDIFLSARNTWAGYQIDGATGRVLWTLGGLASSFKMAPGTQTAWQHDGRVLPDWSRVTFFDDGADPPETNRGGGHSGRERAGARGVRIALDLANHRATLVASYTHPSEPLLEFLGDQGRHADPRGRQHAGRLRRCPANHRVQPGTATILFDAHLPYDMIFYRAYRAPCERAGPQPARPSARASTTSARQSCG